MILLAVAKEVMSQSEVATSLHVSKGDASAEAKVTRVHLFTLDQVRAKDAAAIDETFFPRGASGRRPHGAWT